MCDPRVPEPRKSLQESFLDDIYEQMISSMESDEYQQDQMIYDDEDEDEDEGIYFDLDEAFGSEVIPRIAEYDNLFDRQVLEELLIKRIEHLGRLAYTYNDEMNLRLALSLAEIVEE